MTASPLADEPEDAPRAAGVPGCAPGSWAMRSAEVKHDFGRAKRTIFSACRAAHFCLTAVKVGVRLRTMARRPRAAIAGTGFIGAVHARAVAAGRRRCGGGRLDARARRARRRRASAPRRAYETRRGPRRRPASTSSTSARRTTSTRTLARARADGRQARDLREAARARPRRGAERLAALAAGRRPARPCRSPTASTPPCARRASAIALRRERRRAPRPRDLPAGLAARRRGRQLARRRRAGRRLARLRRHRLALVRPRGVRLGPPDHPPQRAHHDRRARARARARTGRRSRGATATGAPRGRPPRTPSWSSSRPTAGRSARR